MSSSFYLCRCFYNSNTQQEQECIRLHFGPPEFADGYQPSDEQLALMEKYKGLSCFQIWHTHRADVLQALGNKTGVRIRRRKRTSTETQKKKKASAGKSEIKETSSSGSVPEKQKEGVTVDKSDERQSPTRKSQGKSA